MFGFSRVAQSHFSFHSGRFLFVALRLVSFLDYFLAFGIRTNAFCGNDNGVPNCFLGCLGDDSFLAASYAGIAEFIYHTSVLKPTIIPVSVLTGKKVFFLVD